MEATCRESSDSGDGMHFGRKLHQKEPIDWTVLEGGSNHKLYGREVQGAELRNAFQRCCQREGATSPHEIVLISGPPGSGKTSVANGLKNTVKKAKGFFLSGKFDQLERPENYYPIVHAFSDFARLLEDSKDDKSYLSSLRDSVHACGESNRLVFDMIPALESLFRESVSDKKGRPELAIMDLHQGAYIDKRLAFAFRQFIKAVSSPQRPIVLMLDDLQWADLASIDLLTALVSDTSIRGLMFIGVCRDNEVSLGHHLSVTLRELESNGVGICNIHVGNLGDEAVSQMISEALALRTDSVQLRHLCKFVYAKTQGNIFFVIHLLRSLLEASLLYAHGGCVRFEQDPVLKATFLDTSSPGSLITARLLRLPKNVQDVLRTASCFGAEFVASHLEKIFGRDVSTELASANHRGLVSFHDNSVSVRFAHDRIQAACYAMIPEGEKDALHLEIGLVLWRELAPNGDDSFAIVVNQLRLGAHLIRSQDERHRMAMLLLEGAKKATKSAAFSTAASHLSLGIDLLGPRHWRDQYNLSLDLYLMAAEVEYCNGKIDRMDELIHEVVENARSTSDRVKALTMAIYSLGTRRDHQAAIALGFQTLRELGVRFPRKARVLGLLFEFFKTRRMLRRLSDDDILGLPVMRDPGQLAGMRIMIILFTDTLLIGSMMTPLLSLRMVQSTLQNGISGMSAAALAHFALIVVIGFGDMELGVRMANLSLRLLETFQAKEWLPRIYFSVFGGVFASTMPSRDLRKQCLAAHRIGMATGDIEYSCHTANQYTIGCIIGGVNLSRLHADTTVFVEIMRTSNQINTLDLLLPFVQLILNLTRRSDNPLRLKGDALDFDSAMDAAIASKNEICMAFLLMCKLLLLTVLGAYREAAPVGADLVTLCSTQVLTGPFTALYLLFHGLAILQSKNLSRRGVHVVKSHIRKIKHFAGICKENFQSKVDFLEAELAAAQGKYDLAMEKYDASISLAESEAIYSELGLAYERAAATLRKTNRVVDSAYYMDKAIEAYENWGATVKVEALKAARV